MVLITNQAGIGRGYYGWAEFQAVQERITADLAARGATFDMVLACPFPAAGQPPYRHPAHPCRKPRPGMILRAAEALGLDLAGSWIVGDRATDLEAGRAAGLAGGVHVLTGHGAGERGAADTLNSQLGTLNSPLSTPSALNSKKIPGRKKSGRTKNIRPQKSNSGRKNNNFRPEISPAEKK